MTSFKYRIQYNVFSAFEGGIDVDISIFGLPFTGEGFRITNSVKVAVKAAGFENFSHRKIQTCDNQ